LPKSQEFSSPQSSLSKHWGTPLFWQFFQRFSNYDFRFLKWCDPKSVTIFQVKICEVGGEGLFLPLFGDAEQAGGCIADRFQSDWYDFLLTPRLLFFWGVVQLPISSVEVSSSVILIFFEAPLSVEGQAFGQNPISALPCGTMLEFSSPFFYIGRRRLPETVCWLGIGQSNGQVCRRCLRFLESLLGLSLAFVSASELDGFYGSPFIYRFSPSSLPKITQFFIKQNSQTPSVQKGFRTSFELLHIEVSNIFQSMATLNHPRCGQQGFAVSFTSWDFFGPSLA